MFSWRKQKEYPAPDLSGVVDRTIYITRHGNSCNNIIESDITGYFTGNDQKNFLNKKSDPSLSVSGVVSVLNLHPPHVEKHTNEPIYVSSCVRTWMTAILLYARKNFDTELPLIVSPFLKEMNHDKGNMPETRVIQKAKMENFYCFLNIVWKNSTGRASMMAKHVLQKNVVIYTLAKVGDKQLIFNYNGRIQFADLSSGNCLPYDIGNETYMQKFDKLATERAKDAVVRPITEGFTPFTDRDVDLNCKLDMALPANYDPCWEIYDPDGIVKFCNWLSNNNLVNFIGDPKINIGKSMLFIVAHSNIMKACLKKSFFISEKLKKELKKNVFGMNGWTLTLAHKTTGWLIPTAYTEGVLKTELSSIELEKEYLCEQDQSHLDIMRGQQYKTRGGKRRKHAQGFRSKRRKHTQGFRSKRRKHNRSFRK